MFALRAEWVSRKVVGMQGIDEVKQPLLHVGGAGQRWPARQNVNLARKPSPQAILPRFKVAWRLGLYMSVLEAVCCKQKVHATNDRDTERGSVGERQAWQNLQGLGPKGPVP